MDLIELAGYLTEAFCIFKSTGKIYTVVRSFCCMYNSYIRIMWLWGSYYCMEAPYKVASCQNIQAEKGTEQLPYK